MVWGDDGWYPPRHCAVRFMMMTAKYIMLSLSGDLLVQQKMCLFLWSWGPTRPNALETMAELIGYEDGQPVTVDITVASSGGASPEACGATSKEPHSVGNLAGRMMCSHDGANS